MAGLPPVALAVLQVFYRERAVMMYKPLAFAFATLLSEIPYVLAQTTLFVPIVSQGFTTDCTDLFFGS